MIESNELRRGNAVMVEGQVGIITQILWNRVEVEIIIADGKTYREIDYDSLEPIEVTKEILDACNLDKQERFHFFHVYTKGNFTINQLRDSLEISFGTSSVPAIVFKGNLFVHHLQNLYFSLTRQELEHHLPTKL